MTNTLEPFSEMRIGDVSIPNRLMMAPVKTAFADGNGDVNHRHLSYYRRRAEGGIGAIIVEPMFIDQVGKEHPKQLGIASYKHVEGLKGLVAAIHESGSVAIAHLNHAGRAANPKASGQSPEAPSEVTCQRTGVKPSVLGSERIKELVRIYTGAVGRAVEAGFDIIEIQFGLGYLISQFISSSSNRRSDEYGGVLENRLRFGKEILESILGDSGSNVPIIARISATLTGDGTDLDDSVQLAKWLEGKGISAIHVASGSTCDSLPWYFQHMRLPAGKNLEWASQIKKQVSIPVIAAGRLGDPPLIRKTLLEGLVDGIALGRPLIADPDLPIKMKNNHDKDVKLCGACLQGCFMRVKSGQGISCILNPEAGHEGELIPTVSTPKKIVVIGGGPGGMSAAITAQKRGHEVIQFDEGELGGRFNIAVIPPGKQEMKKPLKSMIHQVLESDVDLRLGYHVNAEDIINEKPDFVILATGSVSIIPEINGAEEVISSDDVLLGRKVTGKKVLIIGGGMVGLETAEYLAERVNQVTVVEMLDEVGGDMEPITRKLLMKNLKSRGVMILTNTKIDHLMNGSAFIDTQDGKKEIGTFDTVVSATGSKPANSLEKELIDAGIEVQCIGDARKPHDIFAAVTDGNNLGRIL